jgi:hypothetical protein
LEVIPRPVGYWEGWYVTGGYRGPGIRRRLIGNQLSQSRHDALGFGGKWL